MVHFWVDKYIVNLAIWLSGIIAVSSLPSVKFCAYFDASNILYTNLEKYFETGKIGMISLGEPNLYSISIIFVVIVISHFLSKRWLKNSMNQ